MPAKSKELTVTIGGKRIPTDDVFEIIVDLDVNQPDMAHITISNIKGAGSAATKPKDPVVISSGDGTVFQGDVTGIEPQFDHSMPARVTIRALNKMHLLARGRKSKTFEKMTDQDIVKKVCQDAGLSADCDSDPKIKYDHVYQHNQTNLEFILQRAARIGYEVHVEDSKLFFKKPANKDSGIKLSWGGGDDNAIDRFRPRLSSASQLNKVTVHGWDPKKKKEIIGVASAQAQFGADMGASAAPTAETFETDRPIYSQEEAKAIAESILRERQMQYVTGDMQLHGTPKLKAGMTIDIDVQDPKFNGK